MKFIYTQFTMKLKQWNVTELHIHNEIETFTMKYIYNEIQLHNLQWNVPELYTMKFKQLEWNFINHNDI